MLVASVRGEAGDLTAELREDHIRHHVVNPSSKKTPTRLGRRT